MPKEQHHNHEIDQKAVAQLRLKIIDCGWIFRNQPESDYGIDAELERCISAPDGKKYVTGEIFKAQIKGTETIELVDGESMVAFDIEKDDLEYITGLTAAPLLVIVDVITQRAFWYDIKEQGTKLLNEKPDNKWYRIKTPVDHEIIPQNAPRFYEHLHQAQYLTFRQGLIRHLTEKEIASALLDLNNLQNTLAPPGHRVFTRDPDTYHSPGTVMSILEAGNAMDVVQGDDFKPGDEIKVHMLLQFPSDGEGEKAREEWEKHMRGETATVDLPDKYVKNIKIVAGKQTIANMDSARVHLGAPRRKMMLVLKSKKTGEQICVTGESWSDPGKLRFDSTMFDTSQSVHLDLAIEIPAMKVVVGLSLNALSIPTCSDALYIISLLKSFGDGIEFFAETGGILRKLGATAASPLEFSDDGIDFVRRMTTIETMAKVTFPFRRLKDITKPEIDNAIMLSSLLANENVILPMTLSGSPTKGRTLTPDGQYVRMEYPEEIQFRILGQQITWSEGLIAEGRCERSEQVTEDGQVSVQMYIPRCRIRTSKNGQAPSPTDEP